MIVFHWYNIFTKSVPVTRTRHRHFVEWIILTWRKTGIQMCFFESADSKNTCVSHLDS